MLGPLLLTYVIGVWRVTLNAFQWGLAVLYIVGQWALAQSRARRRAAFSSLWQNEHAATSPSVVTMIMLPVRVSSVAEPLGSRL